MHGFGNDEFRYGSAKLADRAMLEAAGLLTYSPDSLYSGLSEDGEIIWYGGGERSIAGSVFVMPPRTGKYKDYMLYHTALGGSRHSRIIIDLKAECAYTTRTVAFEGRYAIYWNPNRYPNLSCDHINPTEHIFLGSGTEQEDIAALAPHIVQESGSAQSIHFEETAQRYLLPICLNITERDGVLTLPALYDYVQALLVGGGKWKHECAFYLARSNYSVCHDFLQEVARGYDGDGSGFEASCGELSKAVKCLSSPLLRESLSPPYTFSFRDLGDPHQLYSLYLLAKEDFIKPWNMAYRLILHGAKRAKQNAPSAPRQIWYLDEASSFKKFSLIPELYSFGAGLGIVPISFWQNTSQMLVHGENGAREIMGGAGQKVFAAMRDEKSASEVSRMIGSETLSYDDENVQARSQFAYNKSLASMLAGADPLEASMEALHYSQASARPSKMARLVRQPAELLRMPDDRAWMWIQGVPAAIYARRRGYFETSWMAGRYTGSPYYPPEDAVQIMTPNGPQTRRVITERVPDRYAHYPQYKDGHWAYVEGFKP